MSSDDTDMDWELVPAANAFVTAVKPALEFLNINGEWDDAGDNLMFKATLPTGTKMEELKIESTEDGKLLKLSKVLPEGDNGDGEHEAAVMWVLKECCSSGDGKIDISKSFNLPEGVIVKPNCFKASVEDGVLNVIFTKLKSKKKIMSKVLGVVAKAVPVVVLIAVNIVDDNN
ncbi:hypothetical protein CICLE_v10029389mg [Citrus x clementina]|uniref:SHSP domain-containing protein n=3 Tax=Citrus TaxID=2706 RepID=A0A067EVY0_CITSI|nr:hypothetical protein CICLE_v10029389mg [Citrus x clementina]KDO58090.1 hypothetical protein CISIN_1g039847mg [Citrus sinensis]GAY68280.1 hypothetical protein CUMW_262920 [Citrus unshiu]